MRIEIGEIENRDTYEVFIADEMICKTRTPLCSAARILLDRGIDPDTILEKVRKGSTRVDMRAVIGEAAKLTVWDGGKYTPQFAKYKPHPGHEGLDQD
jgi:hypothetical protein